MTVRGSREKVVTEIKVWGEELSTNCLNNTADSSLKTSARGTAASQTSAKVFGYSVDGMVNNAENILPLYHSVLNSHLAYCPRPSASSKRSCRNKWRSESKSENKWVGSGGRGRTMAGRAWKGWGLFISDRRQKRRDTARQNTKYSRIRCLRHFSLPCCVTQE